jgi:cytochrome c biogenesis factor
MCFGEMRREYRSYHFKEVGIFVDSFDSDIINVAHSLMHLKIIIIIAGIMISCTTHSEKNVLVVEKNKKGQIVKEVSEGYDNGEGSYYRTIFFDTLGRITRINQVLDKTKTVETYEFSDSSTYEFTYYGLGNTDNYSDSNYKVSEQDIRFSKHIRINSKGIEVYELTKWYQDSVYCEEIIYDSTGKELSFKNVECR